MGFMGSGKSTVGALLASELGWRFVDVDQELEAREGRDIPRIFTEDGEATFREIEHEVTSELLRGESHIVLATGGGWPCREGRLEALSEDTLSIWLRVGAAAALERVRSQGTRRPLLDVDDPIARIQDLLVRREPYYRKARWTVDTERHPPRDAVRRVTERLRTGSERPLHL